MTSQRARTDSVAVRPKGPTERHLERPFHDSATRAPSPA
jgi:hypothetical protein